MQDGYVTVSDLNQYIKQRVSEDENLTGLFVRGELSNFTHHQKSGHFYFTLKDEKSSIKAVMFRGSAQYVRFQPESGMSVIVFGRVGYFERDGVLQFYCEDMQPDGIGALYQAFEQLKEKLTKQGWFDESQKKPLPKYPQKIAVITAKGGAALQDVLNIIGRRYPIAEIVLLPAMVQGDQAPDSVAKCLEQVSFHPEIDLVIVARGGGSLEDLWAFNTEKVATAIYNCPIPVVSAIGHETDYTIADFVADLRAPTPSAAAELATPDRSALRSSLDSADRMLYNYTIDLLEKREQMLQRQQTALQRLSPQKRMELLHEQLLTASSALQQGVERRLETSTHRFLAGVELLNALSPLRVLTRGYSLTYADGHLIKSENDAVIGQQLTTILQDGELISEVTSYGGKKANAGKNSG